MVGDMLRVTLNFDLSKIKPATLSDRSLAMH